MVIRVDFFKDKVNNECLKKILKESDFILNSINFTEQVL